jgi:hypothetical protein
VGVYSNDVLKLALIKEKEFSELFQSILQVIWDHQWIRHEWRIIPLHRYDKIYDWFYRSCCCWFFILAPLKTIFTTSKQHYFGKKHFLTHLPLTRNKCRSTSIKKTATLKSHNKAILEVQCINAAERIYVVKNEFAILMIQRQLAPLVLFSLPLKSVFLSHRKNFFIMKSNFFTDFSIINGKIITRESNSVQRVMPTNLSCTKLYSSVLAFFFCAAIFNRADEILRQLYSSPHTLLVIIWLRAHRAHNLFR